MTSKKLLFSIIALAMCTIIQAQKEIPDSARELMFDPNGAFTRVVATDEDVAAKLITINPLIDDVPWKKTVLRVIDLREEQNKSLFYPCSDMREDTQKNLFAIIFYNFLKGKLIGYLDQKNPAQTYVPLFIESNQVVPSDSTTFPYLSYEYFEGEETEFAKINKITQSCVKYYIQEVWYFDKHTSTFKSKILAIAPVFDPRYNANADAGGTLGGYEEENRPGGVWFWFPYEKLRPFLQEEYIKMSGRNTQPLLNFDDFFTTRQFYSYVIKDFDLRSKDVDNTVYLPDDDPNKPYRIREEEERIEAEILDFEQDLWNY